MHLDVWTFGLQAANFLVLVWLLHRFLYRPVLGVIAARKAAADKMIDDVKAEKTAVDALKADLERHRAAMADERDATLKAARHDAESERDAILAKARADADRARADALKAFERERAEAVKTIGRDAAKLAVAMVRRLLGETPSVLVQEQMLERLCDDVRSLPTGTKSRIAERLASLGQTPEVVTAVTLSKAARARLTGRLCEALGADLKPTFRIDPDLLAGVAVHFPFTILRRCWSEDLKRIEAELIHDDGAQKVA